MTKTICYALSLICALLLNPIYGQVLHYEDQIIESITIVVHTQDGSIDSKAILARLGTNEGGFFSQAEFDEDLKVLANDYDRVEPTLGSTRS